MGGAVGGVGGSYYGANQGAMPGGRGAAAAGMYGPQTSTRGATHGMNLKQARGAIMRMKSQAQQSNYANYQQQQYHQQQQQQQYDAYSRGGYDEYNNGAG